MMKKMFGTALVATSFALVAPTAAYAGCDGLSGKDLKKCEKQAKAQAKADARTTPFTPSELDAALSAWDGDDNPFATDEYRVRIDSCGLASVDAFVNDATRLQAIIVGSRFMIDQIGAGNADAIAAAPALVGMIMEVPELAQGLIAKGNEMPNTLPNEIAGPDALKLPKCLPLVADSVQALTGAVSEAPEVAKSLKNVVASPGAAAGAAAGMAVEKATDAAGEAAGDAVENTVEKVEDATGGN